MDGLARLETVVCAIAVFIILVAIATIIYIKIENDFRNKLR